MVLTESQRTLADTMGEISELCWFAGWLNGTEYRLWRFITDLGDDGDWGQDRIPQQFRERLRQLSDATSGWIYWRDGPDVPRDEHGETFATLEEWQRLYETWSQANWTANASPPGGLP